MSKPYHSFSRRAGSALKWGLVAIFVALVVLFWPNPRRQIERQLVGMAEAISHHGSSVSRDWLEGLSKNIHENCSSPVTTVTVAGHLNEAMSKDEIVQGVTQIAADFTYFSVRLEHLTVELSNESTRAQASADAIIESTRENRVDRERRHVTFSLERVEGKYRVIAVEASANIVNQPEPRP